MRIVQLADTIGTMYSYGEMQFQAQCPTHGKWVTFQVNHVARILSREPEQLVSRYAEQAVKEKCADCVEDAARVVVPASRWPEGAEL